MVYEVILVHGFRELESVIVEVTRKSDRITAMTQHGNTYTIIIEK